MKLMKKLGVMGLTLAMGLSLLSACSGGTAGGDATTSTANPSAPAVTQSAAPAGDAAFTTVEAGKLHMATNASFPPYESVKDDGTFEGIDIEIAGLIAEKLGLELVVDDMDFTSVVTSVQTGKEDIAMAGLTVNPDREKNVDFTDSYATGIQVIIVTEGSDIATVDDLDGKMIGTQESTTGYTYCSDTPENGGYGEDHVVAYANGATAVQALLAGKVDCVVIDNEPAKAYVAANPGLKILETEFAVEDYAIGVSKENSALREAVNGALKELIADGSVKAVIDKYISAS